MIIGIIGNIGSGKDTIAEYLVSKYQYERDSFARPLKDAVSAVFGWDRFLLEGQTKESRAWREEVDTWWAERLDIPHLTPRWVLQNWGTEVCRHGFHSDIWIASLENRLTISKSANIVISDCRFTNEIDVIKKTGGKIIQVTRGMSSHWEKHEIAAANGDVDAIKLLKEAGIHESEWAWRSAKPDVVLVNNGSIDELYADVDRITHL